LHSYYIISQGILQDSEAFGGGGGGFSVFLRFCQEKRSIAPEKLRFGKMDAKRIQDFMLWLESSQESSPSTYNQRLAAVRPFFRYLQIEALEQPLLSTSVLAIRHYNYFLADRHGFEHAGA
jgi:hypothetical protein